MVRAVLELDVLVETVVGRVVILEVIRGEEIAVPEEELFKMMEEELVMAYGGRVTGGV